MSIKRKLILIGICIAIVIVVFTVNVVRTLNEGKKSEPEVTVVQENVITRAEAYRLISYLDYNKAERESLVKGITYSKKEMSGWYDSYVNAVWKMGLIESKVTVTPMEALTYGSCKELMDRLILTYPDFQAVYTGISFNFTKAADEMPLLDFLELYEAMLTALPIENQNIKPMTLLVLGNEITDGTAERMVTNLGKFYYKNAKSYETYYEELLQVQMNTATNLSEEESTGNNGNAEGEKLNTNGEELNTKGEELNTEGEELNTEGEDLSTKGKEPNTEGQELNSTERQLNLVEQYLDKGIKALVCDNEIILITSVTLEKIVIPNVWIEKGEGLQVDTFVNGISKSFTAQYKLSNSVEKVVGDITIENQKVVKILQKPDIIKGKVLQSGEDYIEIEGYGKVPLEVDYKIYKLYGTLSMEPTSSILVGYENTNFVVSLGKISAALITEGIKAENIRVLLLTSGYKASYHQKVEVTATTDFTVSNQDKETTYTEGEIVTIEPGDELLSSSRITIKPVSEEGRIEILSIERSTGYPKYRGTVEIAEGEQGLLIVNDLPLEEYLYSVIPSEMPTYYGLESLKVQAVCARSYAYKHLLANSLSQYGAHVNDSVAYQVYNNIAENEDSVLAVKDTYGKVIEYDDEVITAYYFSTSSGHTATASNVWANDIDYPYLVGKLLYVDLGGEGDDTQNEIALGYEDLSSEENFRSFMETKEIATYDSGFNWYRWKVTMKLEEIEKVINQNLSNRYLANPELILTLTSKADKGEEAVYESIPVDSIGDIVDISVVKRESSGIISELLITGSKTTIKVRTEYNIRALLAPTYDTVIRQDESKVENLTLLPSAFFLIDKKDKSGKLSSITLTGGGYGHGVGMSQNGVKALADAGEDYETIVAYFYEGTDMGFIYE